MFDLCVIWFCIIFVIFSANVIFKNNSASILKYLHEYLRQKTGTMRLGFDMAMKPAFFFFACYCDIFSNNKSEFIVIIRVAIVNRPDSQRHSINWFWKTRFFCLSRRFWSRRSWTEWAVSAHTRIVGWVRRSQRRLENATCVYIHLWVSYWEKIGMYSIADLVTSS